MNAYKIAKISTKQHAKREEAGGFRSGAGGRASWRRHKRDRSSCIRVRIKRDTAARVTEAT